MARGTGRWIAAVDPPPVSVEVVRYGCAALVVAAVVATAAALVSAELRPDRPAAAAEVDSAVLIDLPPATSSAQPAGTEQPAAAAQDTPPQIDPKPTDSAPVDAPPQDMAPPSPPAAPNPIAVLPQKVETAPQPRPTPTPPQASPADQAPSGAEMPAKTDPDIAENDRPQASAHVITLWQKALMRRLEVAKRALGHPAHGLGVVTVAFAIDTNGRLVSAHIAHGSGSTALDDTALDLVKRAAPFPVPPRGAGPADRSFVVPVLFKR